MKKSVILLVLIISSLTASAQIHQGDQSLLGQIGYQSNFDRVLLGAQYRYVLFDNFRVAPDATFFFPKDNVTGLDFNANLQYVFELEYQLLTYPLVGLNMANNRFSGKYVDGKKIKSDGYTDWGFNLGGGLTYEFKNSSSFINLEAKYIFGTTDAFSFGIGYGVKY